MDMADIFWNYPEDAEKEAETEAQEEITDILEGKLAGEATPANADGGAPGNVPGKIWIFGAILAALLLALAGLYWVKRRKQDREDEEPETAEDEIIQEEDLKIKTEAIPNSVSPRRPQGIYAGKVHNIGKRSSQQDSFGISDLDGKEGRKKGVLAIVADGMGGLSKGGEISAMVTLSMMQYFDQNPMAASPEKELLQMLGEANQKVNEFLGESGKGKSGSTLTAVLIKDMNLYWISVGDSHIYLYRDHSLMQINRDHVYGALLDERAAKGEISFASAAGDPQRKALTSFIGMGKLSQIDRNIRPLKLKTGDRIILASDGIFGTLSDEEMILAMQAPIEESGSIMDQMIRDKNRKTQDNYTAVILECL